MIRNPKALGLALVTAFALSAIGASAASAQKGMITSVSSPFWLHGVDEIPTEPKLHVFGGTIECHTTYTGGKVKATDQKTGHHLGLLTGAVDFTTTPTYSDCKVGTGFPATYTMNGCDYVIHIGETVPGSNDQYNVTTDLVCPEGKEITIDIYETTTKHAAEPLKPLCVIHVPGGAANDGLKGATLTDEPTSDHLTLGGTVEDITMTLTGPSACVPNNVTTTEATLQLEATIEGRTAATGGQAVPLGLSHKG